jgi:hypothetical protein
VIRICRQGIPAALPAAVDPGEGAKLVGDASASGRVSPRAEKPGSCAGFSRKETAGLVRRIRPGSRRGSGNERFVIARPPRLRRRHVTRRRKRRSFAARIECGLAGPAAVRSGCASSELQIGETLQGGRVEIDRIGGPMPTRRRCSGHRCAGVAERPQDRLPELGFADGEGSSGPRCSTSRLGPPERGLERWGWGRAARIGVTSCARPPGGGVARRGTSRLAEASRRSARRPGCRGSQPPSLPATSAWPTRSRRHHRRRRSEEGGDLSAAASAERRFYRQLRDRLAVGRAAVGVQRHSWKARADGRSK